MMTYQKIFHSHRLLAEARSDVSENLKSDSAVKKQETEEKPDGAAPKPESDSAVKKEETEEKPDGAAPKPKSDSAVKNEETVEKTKIAIKIKPDVQ